jgi:hypothetical protein
VPANLADWLAGEALADVVDRVVGADTGSPRPPGDGPAADAGSYPRRLLGLMTYAYATGRYDSHEIAEDPGASPRLAERLAPNPPDWDCLRRFRRLHRPRLQRCLEEVCRIAWCHHHAASATAPAEPEPTHAAEPPTELRSRIAAEATRRLNRAALCDSLALDD